METLLNRYRHITALLLVVVVQLLLLAYQVKSAQDVRLIRVWAVSAVTPLARTIEAVRSSVATFFGNYVSLRDIRTEHKQLQAEVDRLKLENQFLKSELSTADRARSLSVFQSRTQSRTLAARVIGMGAGTGSSVRFVDRGSLNGVQKGMAVITPDGIVGKVTSVFPYASQVMLITDSNFAAGVVSQKNHVRGTLRGSGYGNCKIDFVENEAKVETGEWFFTSGDDRVFPKGFPAGQVRAAKQGSTFQDIALEPSGLKQGVEEVLIVLEGVHQQIPEQQTAIGAPVYIAPPAPADESAPVTASPSRAAPGTEADRLRERYKTLGEEQGHVFGEGGPGARPPDFTKVATPAATKPVVAKPQTNGENPPPTPRP